MFNHKDNARKAYPCSLGVGSTSRSCRGLQITCFTYSILIKYWESNDQNAQNVY